MPVSVIKDNIDLLAELLSIFYKTCIHDGVLPKQLKIAKVVPIHKKCSKQYETYYLRKQKSLSCY